MQGALREGNKIFDSSVARGEPFEFQLGGGRVIPGTSPKSQIQISFLIVILSRLGAGSARNVCW